MKEILKNAALRAVCILILGILFILQPEAATWFTIVTGICFVIPGSVALVSLFSKKSDMKVPFMFSVLAVGCILFGLVLILLPNVFHDSLLYIMSGLLVLFGALQLWTILAERRRGIRIHGFFFVIPVVLILTAFYLFLYRADFPEVPPFVVIGSAYVLYALTDLCVSLFIFRGRKALEKPALPEETPTA